MSLTTAIAANASIAALQDERRHVTHLVQCVFADPLGANASSLAEQLLSFTAGHVLPHSSAEEYWMTELDHPGLYVHMSDHARLNDYVKSIREELITCDDDRDDLLIVSNRLLGNWLYRHVNTFDLRLGDHLARMFR